MAIMYDLRCGISSERPLHLLSEKRSRESSIRSSMAHGPWLHNLELKPRRCSIQNIARRCSRCVRAIMGAENSGGEEAAGPSAQCSERHAAAKFWGSGMPRVRQSAGMPSLVATAAAAADDDDDSRSSTGVGNVDLRTPSAKVRARCGISVTQNILHRIFGTFAVRNMPLI